MLLPALSLDWLMWKCAGAEFQQDCCRVSCPALMDKLRPSNFISLFHARQIGEAMGSRVFPFVVSGVYNETTRQAV